VCVCVCLQAEMLSLSCTFVPGSCFFGLSAQHFSKTAKGPWLRSTDMNIVGQV
jgi:hypothetical protein